MELWQTKSNKFAKVNCGGWGGGGGGAGGDKINLLKMEKNSCTKVQEDLKQTM